MSGLHANIKIKSTFQSGIGLIELLVSMLIGLFIMGGVLQLFSTSSQNAVAVSGSSRIQENVRFAFSRIADDIAQSGTLGCMSSSVAGSDFATNNPLVAEAVTLAGASFNFDVAMPIRIVNATDSGATAASGAGRAPGTDEFSIGYIDNAVRLDVTDIGITSVTVAAADLAAGSIGANIDDDDLVSVSNCYEAAIFSISGIAGGVISHAAGFDKNISSFRPNDGTANVISPYYLYAGKTGAYEYSIGTSAGAADCVRGANAETAVLGQANCALFRTRNDLAVGVTTRQELAQGVHDIQVEYGWTDSAGNLRFADSLATPAEIGLVDRMRVTMVFNSIDKVNTDGNNIDQTAGGFIVKTYSRTFNLFNRI